jgi:hypothetical protein
VNLRKDHYRESLTARTVHVARRCVGGGLALPKEEAPSAAGVCRSAVVVVPVNGHQRGAGPPLARGAPASGAPGFK